MTGDPLSLGTRTGLPEDLRARLRAIPRPGWHAHASFGPLTRFYLDRHAMFRELSGLMAADLRALLDHRDAPRGRRTGFARLAQIFLTELQTHHMVEDRHYFPALLRLDPRLGRGFDILERDHEAIDGMLHDFAARANALLSAPGGDEGPARAMLGLVGRVSPLLERHLTDEEEIVIPLMLERGEAALGL